MDILVYGAGAVGGYLGARLSQQAHNVTLVTRQVTADLIASNGLTISENDQRQRTHPTAVTSIRQAFLNGQQYDLIILAMKSYDLISSFDALVAFCPDPKLLLTTQNGIGIEQPLIDQFGANRVIAGSVTIPLRKETSDHIIVEKDGRGLALAPTQAKQNIRQWGSLFQKASIATTVEKDYQAMKWSKALLNMVGNATSAILNRKPGVLYKSDYIFNLEVQMLQEALQVMKALKIPVIDLPGSSAKRLAFGVRRMPRAFLKPILTKVVANGRGNKMPSFQIDLTSGKGKSEVMFHNGAVAEKGAKLGIPTPINHALSDILLKLTNEELDWQAFDGRPKRLAEEIKKYSKQS